jgi:hypothetical protein
MKLNHPVLAPFKAAHDISGHYFGKAWTTHKRFLSEVKHQFGLVPSNGEPLHAFERRVWATVHDKYDPTKGIMLHIVSKPFETTRGVQQVLERYLGIREAPLTAYEGGIRVKLMRGGTIEEPDGSSFMVTMDQPDNTQELIEHTRNGLESIIEGKPIRHELAAPGFFLTAGFQSERSLDNLFCSMYEKFMENETFIQLHEGIHAIHLNNHRYGRRTGQLENHVVRTVALINIPIFGPLYRFPRFACDVESETLAYKVGIDAFAEDILNRAALQYRSRSGEGIDEQVLDDIKVGFRDMSTRLTKTIIRERYLHNPLKGYGSPTGGYAIGLSRSFLGAVFLGHHNIVSQALGVWFIAGAASSFIKIPLSLYFSRKIDRCVDTIDRLSAVYGSSGKAFYETLGSSFKEMENIAAQSPALPSRA